MEVMPCVRKFLSDLFHIFFSKKFIEFTLLGGINTFNTAWISSLCALFMQKNAAACVGYACSLTFAYYMNCRLIFSSRPTKRGYLRFWITYIPSFIIYALVTFLTINTMHLPQFWGTVLAATISGPLTYALMKFYTFRN